MKTKKNNISGKKVLKEDMKIIGKDLSLFLKTLRASHKMTQDQLSRRSKISISKIRKMEAGLKIFSIAEAKTLAKIFKTTPEKIIRFELL